MSSLFLIIGLTILQFLLLFFNIRMYEKIKKNKNETNKLEKQREEMDKARASIYDAGRDGGVIYFKNEWSDIGIGDFTDVQETPDCLAPIIKDAITGETFIHYGRMFALNDVNFSALVKLAPDERWAISAVRSYVLPEPTDTPIRTRQQWIDALISVGRFDLVEMAIGLKNIPEVMLSSQEIDDMVSMKCSSNTPEQKE